VNEKQNFRFRKYALCPSPSLTFDRSLKLVHGTVVKIYSENFLWYLVPGLISSLIRTQKAQKYFVDAELNSMLGTSDAESDVESEVPVFVTRSASSWGHLVAPSSGAYRHTSVIGDLALCCSGCSLFFFIFFACRFRT